MRPRFTLPLSSALALVAALALAGPSSLLQAQRARAATKFFADDPLTRVADTQDASKAQPRELSLTYDASINLFGRPGLNEVGRAESINTIDEVPDSAWYTNRTALVPDDIRRGVTDDTGPAPGQWIVSRKSNGVSPGFTITDQRGRRYFVKFDPPGLPELGTGTEAVVTRLFHALGYYVPQLNIATLRRENLAIAPDATVRMPNGSRRRMHHSDLYEQLSRAEQNPDGSYRVSVAAALEGKPLEGFKYEGTRSDDPNDVVPHENRRELRGLRVFSAWLNHTDAKAINSMDTLITENGRSIVRHNLIDFNAALGSAGVGLRDRRDGYEYIVEMGATARALPAFGFNPRRWATIDYPRLRGIGRFESKAFNPEEWRPRVPNPAYVRSRPDDTFWAARKLMGISDDIIRAAVAAGQYSNKLAEQFLVDALIERRDKIGRTWLTAINPVVDPALAADGSLTFRNAAVDHNFATAPGSYVVKWYRFDNGTGESQEIGTRTGQPPFAAPGDLAGSFVRVDIGAVDPAHPTWERPVRVHFRKSGAGWALVGFDRMPDAPPMRPGLVGAEPR
jgi:hypothetical protein